MLPQPRTNRVYSLRRNVTVPKLSPVYLNVGFHVGIDIDDALAEAIELADRLGVALRGEINEIPVFVFPGDTVERARAHLDSVRKVMKG